MQRVALRALLLRDHQGRVVQAVADTKQRRKDLRDGRMAQQRSERLTVRLSPPKHATKVHASRRPVTRKLGRFAAVQPARAQLAGALIKPVSVRVDGRVCLLNKVAVKDIAYHDKTIQIEEVLLRFRHAFRRFRHVVLVA